MTLIKLENRESNLEICVQVRQLGKQSMKLLPIMLQRNSKRFHNYFVSSDLGPSMLGQNPRFKGQKGNSLLLYAQILSSQLLT